MYAGRFSVNLEKVLGSWLQWFVGASEEEEGWSGVVQWDAEVLGHV